MKKGWKRGLDIEDLVDISGLEKAEVLRIIAEMGKEKS